MRASPEEESSNESGLDDVLKAIGFPKYGKALFHEQRLGRVSQDPAVLLYSFGFGPP